MERKYSLDKLLCRTTCVGITCRVVWFTLSMQAFYSTEAQECILVEITETSLMEVEEVTARNGRIIVDLALQY